jgi:hypothetical protein
MMRFNENEQYFFFYCFHSVLILLLIKLIKQLIKQLSNFESILVFIKIRDYR